MFAFQNVGISIYFLLLQKHEKNKAGKTILQSEYNRIIYL